MFTEHTVPATMLRLHVLPCWILPTRLIVGPRCAKWRMPPSYRWATCNPGPDITFSFSDEKMEAKKWLGPLPLTHTIGAWFRQDGKRADLTKPGHFPHCRRLPPLLQDTELTAAGSAVWSLLARVLRVLVVLSACPTLRHVSACSKPVHPVRPSSNVLNFSLDPSFF